MRPGRLIPILMAALTAAGCMQSAFVPDSAAVSRAGLTVPPNLDSFAYERRAAAPSKAYAQAQVPHA